MKDHVARFTTTTNYRIALVRCSQTAQLIGNEQHKLTNKPLSYFSDGMVAALLLATQLKGNGVLSYEFDSDGPFDNYRCDATPLGYIRAMIPSSTFDKISTWDNKSPLIGKGNLYIGKKINQTKKPYQSVIKLVSENLTLNTIYYLKISEQINGIIHLCTMVKNNKVIHSDGFLVEELPGTTDEDRTRMENQINSIKEPGILFQNQDEDDVIIKRLLGNLTYNHIKDFDINFACPCTEKRFSQNLALISRNELNSLTDESDEIITECDFCKKVYQFKLKDILQFKNNLN
ncbi:MAG: hypothetical protein COA79_11055 [Planctomycetota bacterium]|nr:MAG: hypothetical protein COA79_11055 [Planctomycetota bacterium]